ncbi:MAG: ATP-binding protein [Clostridiales Family XIII bacterium]|jgi:Na+-driven multidrug efflux pump/anti-sigma regulatory factor (Ser/Thr protein kinase)|nr:ATP-binding protein [Clostridiales Family XIII bacterium]
MNADIKDSRDNSIIIGTNGYLVNNLLKGLLIVSIVMMFGATVSMSVDTIMGGHFVGADAIAAMNVTMPIFVAVSLISGIIANGGSALAARYLGQNEKAKVNSLFTFVLLADLVVGLILIACVFPNAEQIAVTIGAKDEVVKTLSVQYIHGILIGILPIMFNASLLGFVRVAGNPHLSAVSVLCMSGVNIALNYVFAGLLGMGMFGLALATGAGYIVSCVISLNYLLRGKCFLKLSKLDGIYKKAPTVVNMGFPSALTSLTSVVRGVVLNIVVATQIGTIALQAMSVQSSVANLVGCASLGVGFTIIPLAGIFFGEQDKLALKKTVKGSLTMGLFINIAFAAIISLLAKPLALMFNITDPATISMIMRSIWFFAVSMPFAMASYAFVCYYQNIKRVWIANTIIISKVVFLLVFTLPFISSLADTAIWMGGMLSEVLSTLLVLAIVGVLKKKFPRSMDDLLLLPKEWDDDFPRYEVSLKNDLDACVGFSSDIQDFCAENGVSAKMSYYVALCLEEMVSNIINYGFKDDKDHFIDIKVILEDGKTKLRIRDSGMEFNPIDYSEKQDTKNSAGNPAEGQDDEYANIGIKIVKELAYDLDYRYTMRLNNLFVELVEEEALKLQASSENWAQAKQFLQNALAPYSIPDRTAKWLTLASEELYIMAIREGAGEILMKMKPVKNGMKVNFQYEGGFDYSDDSQDIGFNIVKKTMDIFRYSSDSKMSNLAIYKYWN